MRNKRYAKTIVLQGVNAEGECQIVCTMIPIDTPTFSCHSGNFGKIGTVYQQIDSGGNALQPKQCWPSLRDIFFHRKYEKVVRLKHPKIDGTYLLTLCFALSDTELGEEHQHHFAVLHKKQWYKVKENHLDAARLGLNHLQYNHDKGMAGFYP